jgi:malate dehydrogenase (oxaloacetate-decarboxylating)
VQWEDFAKHKAFVLLERYRERILSFNDDIQGTGATALAALFSAMRAKREQFKDQRFVIVGMGQAGSGIAYTSHTALRHEGVPEHELCRYVYAIDQPGLLCQDTPGLEEAQRPFAQPRENIAGWSLQGASRIGLPEVVKHAKATVVIGVTAQPGLFDQNILRMVAGHTARPVVFALSNPTSKSECSLSDAVAATEGRVLFASGSPFDPINAHGRTVVASQCNNMFIFPGMGLGALVARSTKVTAAMFLAASRALSQMVTSAELERGMLLPELKSVREASARVALAAALQARDAGHGRLLDDAAMEAAVRAAQWQPHYPQYRPGVWPGR